MKNINATTEQTDATARLIAAAPDMADALKATLEYWESTGFAICDEGCHCVVDVVRAALAKAEIR
jgi:hypothetical protein